MRKAPMFLLAVTCLVVAFGCQPAHAADPTPTKDLMDNPIPPGDDPGPDPKKIKVCLDRSNCETPTPAPLSAIEALSTFTGTRGPDMPGMGYCVATVLPDGSTGLVNVPFHAPDALNMEPTRQSIANALRLLAIQYEHKCVAAAVKLEGFERGRQAVEACGATVLAMQERASRVLFSWEVPYTPASPSPTVSSDVFRRVDLEPGTTCACSTHQTAGVLPVPCAGGCTDCWLCQ